MTLAEYLKESEQTDEAFAEIVKISRPMISKLRKRSIKPSADLALRIMKATGDRVGLADIMPLGADQEADISPERWGGAEEVRALDSAEIDDAKAALCR